MSTMMHRMTFRDFLLFGCSVSLLIVLLWPAGSTKQLIEIRTDSGDLQQYSVATNDPSLRLLKRRIKSWENETSSRPLRLARWHHELAEFYSLRNRGDQESDIALVSYTDSNGGEPEHDAGLFWAGSFWSELRDDAQIRIAEAKRDIRIRRDSVVLPVTLGSVTQSIPTPLAYPIAILVASAIVAVAVLRQQICPPIEILLWRGLYATSVCSAAVFLVIANLG